MLVSVCDATRAVGKSPTADNQKNRYKILDQHIYLDRGVLSQRLIYNAYCVTDAHEHIVVVINFRTC